MTDQATQLRAMMEVKDRRGPRREVISRAPGGHVELSSQIIAPLNLPPSIPTGMVSYGPICSRRSTRALHGHTVVSTPQLPPRLARAIAISSGKGGVGKSNLAVNLAVAMSQLGLKVCLLDADLGLANADVLCNISPRLTLEHVVNGKCRLADAMLLAPGGFRLIPGASGVTKLADLTVANRLAILDQLAALEEAADVILIDCGAGISANVVAFAAAAHTVIVTTTPEPTAITDCYSMIKTLLTHRPARERDSKLNPAHLSSVSVRPRIQVAVNMVSDQSEGRSVFHRIDHVSRTFLNEPLQFGGCVPMDGAVSTAVRHRIPFLLHSPNGPATQSVRQMAAGLIKADRNGTAVAESSVRASPIVNACPSGPPRDGFFSRLAIWLGFVEYVD